MTRPLYVVDAFSDRPLAGNPAAVVLDGAGLGETRMQAIAAELGHSETAFPLPSREPGAAWHLRWFTPASEVTFCGHATLATFAVLANEVKRLHVGRETVRTSFSCKSGVFHVELSRDEREVLKVRIETPRTRFEPVAVRGDVLTALGLVPEVLDPSLPPCRSTPVEGNLFLAVRDREALARCRADADALVALGKELPVTGYVVFTRDPAPGVDAASRCFFPEQGIAEDPVTGSAAGQLAVLLHEARPGPLPRSLVFTQGDELGRPGRIEIDLREEGSAVRAFIGGSARVVVRGELDLP